MERLTVALVQLNQIWEDKESNKQRIQALIAGVSADLVVLPEMTLTGFSMDAGRTSLDDSDHQWFASLALHSSKAIVYGGVSEGRNCLFFCDEKGQVQCRYSKNHLFSYGGEDGFYQAGSGVQPFEWRGWRILPSICYDLRFSPHFWTHAPEIDLILNIANWPAGRALHWRTLLQARAIENQVFVVGVNRTGEDPRLNYSGDSLTISPLGELLADPLSQEVVEVSLDRQQIEQVRSKFPFLRDRKA